MDTSIYITRFNNLIFILLMAEEKHTYIFPFKAGFQAFQIDISTKLTQTVNEEAASSIDELEMKIKVGKQVFKQKLAAEVEHKKHALSSDEDDKPVLTLTDKSTPAKKQKK